MLVARGTCLSPSLKRDMQDAIEQGDGRTILA
jgi:hypothetical protein